MKSRDWWIVGRRKMGLRARGGDALIRSEASTDPRDPAVIEHWHVARPGTSAHFQLSPVKRPDSSLVDHGAYITVLPLDCHWTFTNKLASAKTRNVRFEVAISATIGPDPACDWRSPPRLWPFPLTYASWLSEKPRPDSAVHVNLRYLRKHLPENPAHLSTGRLDSNRSHPLDADEIPLENLL